MDEYQLDQYHFKCGLTCLHGLLFNETLRRLVDAGRFQRHFAQVHGRKISVKFVDGRKCLIILKS